MTRRTPVTTRPAGYGTGPFDRHPALIACCADATDVVTAVEFGRAHDLPIAVRAGGHGVAGRAVCDGGLVIDLRAISQVRVDPGRRLALAGPAR